MKLLRAAMLGAAMLSVAASAQAAGTLRLGTQEDPDQLDPMLGGTFGGRLVFAALCDKLIDLAPNLSFVPQLATKWEWSPDGLALTFTLRDGVTFQDGEPMTAEAVKFNLERDRTTANSSRKGELASVKGVEVVDPHTVRLLLSKPNVPLLAAISDRSGMMVSPKAVQQLGANFFTAPVCSGPFKFTERVAQDHIAADRYPGYWNSAAIHFDHVIIRPTPDATVRLVNLQAGQLDMLEELSPSDFDKVKSNPKFKVTTSSALAYAALTFNLANGPKAAASAFAQNAKLREALEDAVDRDALNKVVMAGLFVPDNQTELPTSPFFDKDFPVPPRNLERAKQLVKESGVDHPTIEFRVPNNPRDVQVAEVLQAMAAEAGIDFKILAGEANANIDAMNHGDYQSVLNNWSGRADPDLNISVYLACDSSQNWGKYCPPGWQNLLDHGRSETDPVKREAVYRDVVKMYATDRPQFVLYHQTWLFASDARLKGFVPVPDGLIRVQGLSME